MQIKTHIPNKRPNLNAQGFTLIEMIGVLAVIAILAAALIPKVFEAINNARVNSTAMAIQTMKTAVIDHYSKWTSLTQNGASGQAVAIQTLPLARYDLMLLKEKLLEKEFSARIGDAPSDPYAFNSTTGVDATVGAATRVELVAAVTANATASNSAYNLDGDTVGNDTTGTAVVQAVITGVSLEDARALNRTIDGIAANLGEGTGGTAAGSTTDDVSGRVKYAQPAAGATTTVYVYLTHR